MSILCLTLVGVVAYTLVVWFENKTSNLWQSDTSSRSFYHVVPYAFMVVPGMLLSLYVLFVVGLGFRLFWRESGGAKRLNIRAWSVALRDAATLRQLQGGGGGCYYPDEEKPSSGRRLLHHSTAYGFLLAFAATCLAALDQKLGHPPPYSYSNAVVILGALGGVGIVVGSTGLLRLKASTPRPDGTREPLSGYTFLISLNLTAASGLLLLLLRDTRVMGPLLVLHLGLLFALYVSAPYGRAVHAVYRLAALARSAAEQLVEPSPQPMSLVAQPQEPSR
jgi:citrate/tricarballylate utilization protein